MWRRAPGFFDVVTYEGNGQVGREVPHSLGVAPEMMWVKSRSSGTDNWMVYNKSRGSSAWLVLNTSQSGQNNSNSPWAEIDPTEDGFYTSGATVVNGIGKSYIAYLFASTPGVCSIGYYTGDGVDVDVDCGFTNGARFVLIKCTGTGDWMYFDTVRGISSTDSPMLKLNETAAQVPGSFIKPFDKGFTVIDEAVNGNQKTYIYMAIA
jgi:hypothetical protein